MSLYVLEPGLFSLVVDRGRPRSRSLGVPVGGAADRASFQLGNALVGNPADAAALEITLAGPTLRAECELACVVYGAPFTLTSDRQPLEMGKSFTLSPGETLQVGKSEAGVRAYLCVAGGIEEPVILGSRSALEPVRRGAVLPCRSGRIGGHFIRRRFQTSRVLRMLPGAQSAWFGEHPLQFAVTSNLNRMGIRLRGEPFAVPARELVSEPVCPGSVQVTRDGQCIVLGVDGQTIGGYPKVAQVITADLDDLAQLRPDDALRFARVSLDEAEAAYRVYRSELDAWLTRLRTAEVLVS